MSHRRAALLAPFRRGATAPATRRARYLAEFIEEPGIDPTPFPIEIVEDPFTGGVCVRQRDGMCVAIERFYYSCEWANDTSGSTPAVS